MKKNLINLVFFTSLKTNEAKGYQLTAAKMTELAQQQPGFLGVESARETVGITVSYWRSLDYIKQWKSNSEHLVAQRKGRQSWYESFHVRIAKVERDYKM